MQHIPQDKAPQRAGILCNDVVFQNYAAIRNGFEKGEFDASTSAEHIRQICGVYSRRELATNATAFKRFLALHTNFEVWANRIPTPR